MDGAALIGKIATYLTLVFAITVHEWAHAWSADRCGDPTARLLGRLTLNPFAHMDLIGTVIIPLYALLAPGGIALIGWGRPVPINAANFRHDARDDILVSLAGPFSNLVTTLVALLLVRLLLFVHHSLAVTAIVYILLPLAGLSFFLAFFNLLPIPPLDGSHLVRAWLNLDARQVYDRLAGFGFIVLLILINTPLWSVFARAIGAAYAVVRGVFFLPV